MGKLLKSLGETLRMKAAVASHLYPVFLCPSLCITGHLRPLISPGRSMVPADTAPPTVLQLGLISFSGTRTGSSPSGLLCALGTTHTRYYTGKGRTDVSVKTTLGCPMSTVIRGLLSSFSFTVTQWKTPSPLRWRTHYWLS